ncbi:unnamed protein product [Alternaria alternata]
MSREVQVKKGSEIQAPDGPQTDGMIRMPAIVNMSDQLCGTVMIAKPHTASAVHHHGEEGVSRIVHPYHPLYTNQHTIVYAAKGHGAIVSGSNGNKRQELAPGDFALIPAYAEHQEINESDEDVVWIITRGGRNPIVQNLAGWSKD